MRAFLFFTATGSERIAFAAGDCQKWIVPKPVVVVEVFVAQRQPEDSLPEQFFDTVLDQVGITTVLEALGEFPHQPMSPVHLTKKKNSTVAGEVASLEIGNHLSRFQSLKCEALLDTLCHAAVEGWLFGIDLNTNTLHQISTRRLFYP